MKTDELNFVPAEIISDAEYQAAAERAERVAFAAEAMGEHVLIKSKQEKPECMNIRNCGDGCGTCIYYEADPQQMQRFYEATK